MANILENLIVHEDRIRQNVNQAASLIATEALMFILAEKMGKQAAHQLLYEISMEAHTTSVRSEDDQSTERRVSDRPLVDLLVAHPDIKDNFTQEEIQQAIDPARHVGLAGQLTDRVVSSAVDWLDAHGDITTEIATCPLVDSGICK